MCVFWGLLWWLGLLLILQRLLNVIVIPSYLVLSFPFIRALQHADVIVLLGARLNWILHFGLPPRYRQDVKVIQVRWKIIIS